MMIYVILFIFTLIGDNIGQIIYENMAEDKSIDAMQTCFKEFYSKQIRTFSNKTNIMARTRLDLSYNELKTMRLKSPVQSEIRV